jgi:hypothetical protein
LTLIHNFDLFLSAAREKLSEIQFAAVWEKGMKMKVDSAIEKTLKTIEGI